MGAQMRVIECRTVETSDCFLTAHRSDGVSRPAHREVRRLLFSRPACWEGDF
jgi:hypothetical protein